MYIQGVKGFRAMHMHKTSINTSNIMQNLWKNFSIFGLETNPSRAHKFLISIIFTQSSTTPIECHHDYIHVGTFKLGDSLL